MEKEMTIRVESSHRIPGEEEERVTFETPGRLLKRSEGFVFRYDEDAALGMQGTHTTLSLERDGIKMIRSGHYRCVMMFRPNARCDCPYHTPYGTMLLCIETKEIACDMTPNGGVVEWAYTMESDGQALGDYRIRISVLPLERKE